MSGLAKLVGYLVLFGLAGYGGYALWQNPEVQTAIEDIIGPMPTTLIDQESSIGSPDANLYHFTLQQESKVRLSVDVLSQHPVDVITTSGHISKPEYVMSVGLKNLADFFTLLFPEESQPNTESVFTHPLSKEAARDFDSGWQTMSAGRYSVIIDNTNAFTESYGDAKLHINVKVIEKTPKNQ